MSTSVDDILGVAESFSDSVEGTSNGEVTLDVVVVGEVIRDLESSPPDGEESILSCMRKIQEGTGVHYMTHIRVDYTLNNSHCRFRQSEKSRAKCRSLEVMYVLYFHCGRDYK